MSIIRPVTARTWKNLFLFCLGLAAGAAFCMKWMENDLRINGEKFTILGLELFYPEGKLLATFSGLDNHVAAILRYHLSFDFAFMAGIYPGITALCMMAREKTSAVTIRKILFVLAAIQLVGWLADIGENYFLYKWINDYQYARVNINDSIPDFMIYRIIVPLKWIIALAGIFFAVPFAVRKRKTGF